MKISVLVLVLLILIWFGLMIRGYQKHRVLIRTLEAEAYCRTSSEEITNSTIGAGARDWELVYKEIYRGCVDFFIKGE